jgi:hypothetical protein
MKINQLYQLFPGLRVKCKDDEHADWEFGTVLSNDGTVAVIDWEDLSEPIEYRGDLSFEDIHTA